jgi:hypothetical protein
MIKLLPIASSTALFSAELSMVSSCMPAALHAFFACTQFACQKVLLSGFNIKKVISFIFITYSSS